MYSQDNAITVNSVSKFYRIWSAPSARITNLGWRLVSRLPLIGLYAQKKQKQGFRSFRALNEISFSVRPGEAVGIVGKNGSGKSTLLQIITGTLQPTTGSVKSSGRIAALLELGSGFNLEFTGRENVILNGAILGFSKNEIEKNMPDIEAFADIGEFIDEPVKTYSSGMMLRLAFAVQIHIEPDILIVDEALSVGDEAFSRKCIARIERLREAGTAVLFVSHAAQTVIQLCDRAIMLNQGDLVIDGAPKKVVHFYQKFVASDANTQADMLATRSIPELETDPATVETPNEAPTSDNMEEFFSPDLKTESALSYDAQGAQIRDCRLTTLQGRPANNLISSRRYLFKYDVTFEDDHEDVAFGMMLTSVNGIEIGGASTWDHADKRRSFRKNARVTVRFEFDCALPEGTYFLRCGIANNQTGFIHRHLDVLPFKVIVPERRIQSGLVDLNTSLTVATSDNPVEIWLDLPRPTNG